MRRAIVAAAVPVLAGLSLPSPAFGQGENAQPLPARTFRITVGGDWWHATDRFSSPTPLNPGLADGTLELLGSYFSAESLGTQRLPLLAPTEAELRTLTGLSGYTLNLGRMLVTLEPSVRTTPIRIEFAPVRRLAIGVSVPIVRARTSIFMRGPDSAAAATQGNVGWNPAFLTPGAFDAFRLELDSALLALQREASGGPPSLQPAATAYLASQRDLLCALYALAGGSAVSASSLCFAGQPVSAAWVLPVGTSEAGDSVTARLSRARADYDQLRSQYAAQGVTLPSFTAAYSLPSAPFDSAGLQRFVTDPAGPLAGDSIGEVVRTGIGDVELSATLQLADGAHLRSQLGVLVRLPTGTVDTADNFLDIGTGDHQRDIELALRNDLIMSEHLWLHAGGRFGTQAGDELLRRVSPWYLPLAPITSSARVRRKLGSYLALDLVPTWQLDDALGVGIGYHYFHQAATTYSYVDPADEARIGLAASVLGEATEVSRMRVGAGVTFSTLSRHAAGRARLPYSVTWAYEKTLWGRGGQVPRAAVMRLVIQVYLSPF